jgi:hypothetical protein
VVSVHIDAQGARERCRHPETLSIHLAGAPTVELAAGDRMSGPLLLTQAGSPLNCHAEIRIVHRLVKGAGMNKPTRPCRSLTAIVATEAYCEDPIDTTMKAEG